jgi:hypothetical protein
MTTDLSIGARTWPEAERATPVVSAADVSAADVVVCGGGPAGVAAALAAARAGASTQLIEVHGCLGGIWTTGLLSCVLDWANKPGIMREIVDELEHRDARQIVGSNGLFYDPEVMKLVLEELCIAAGVRVRLHTRLVAAGRDAANRLAVAITESKSGREAWAGKVFIDATGDGDLAAQAGCGFDVGQERTGQTQPMTLMALLAGIRAEAVTPCLYGGAERHDETIDAFLSELRRAGVTPSYARPMLARIHDDLFVMMANHENGVSGLDAQQITDATLRARAEVHRLVAALRALGGAWTGVRVVATAGQIGVREGRRIQGRYRVTAADAVRGARHADAVCRVTFPVDVHMATGFGNAGVEAQPYDIPLRALIARDVDGLLLAGRCISGDFLAHASYRVTGNAVAMGQAAGRTAALAARSGCQPHEVP